MMKRLAFSFLLLSLLTACVGHDPLLDPRSKVISYTPSEQNHQRLSDSVVLVGGCFDLLHYGHIQYLNKSKEQGAYLVVALEPDESIKHRKKKNPFHNQAQRAYNLASLSVVDRVILLPVLKRYEDYLALVDSIQPKVIAITPDNPQRENLEKQARYVGAEVRVVAPFVEGLSSTALKKYLMDDAHDRSWCGESQLKNEGQ